MEEERQDVDRIVSEETLGELSSEGNGELVEISPPDSVPQPEAETKEQVVEQEARFEDVKVTVETGFDPIPEMPEGGEWDLTDPRLYLNREITWLSFNRRVLQEVANSNNPLIERLKFLAIVSSNTDEFFMKRIGGLKQLVEAGVEDVTVDGRRPIEQIRQCYDLIKVIEEEKSKLHASLQRQLVRNKIYILEYDELREEEIAFLREHFISNIFPLIIPQGVGPAHPFPFISNLSLNLLVTVQHRSHGELSMARVKVPVGPDVPRLTRIGDEDRFVLVEEVIRNNLDILFPAVNIVSCNLFRVTRNANTEKDEEKADDLLELIESELRERKFAPIVRLQVEETMSDLHRRMMCEALDLSTEDLFVIRGMVGKKDIMEICSLPRTTLKFKPHYPIDPPRFKSGSSIFRALREEGPILLHHPYESFTNSVERFLREASVDPDVRAIKMTLYRTSSDSKVIEHLITAAQNEKQVAVVIELKARFDEEANIQWASRLEEKGIHVTYGVIGFKTHAKMILVIRKEFDGFRSYCHVGTGNYHAGTARLYTDLGLLTCDQEIAHDLNEIFNFLTTGYTPTRKYDKVLMAPSTLKRSLIEKIVRETEHAKAGGVGHIQMKLNALEDVDITRSLYRASQAGVKVELVVRDTCRLRPGIPGLSENIRIVSIIGRFLEHARLFYFLNGGEEEYFISSADAMRRNLEHRVEVTVPVEDEMLKAELRKLLDIQLRPDVERWEMKGDGTYEMLQRRNGKLQKDGQQTLIAIAEKRHKHAEKLKKIQSKGKSKKENWAGYLNS